MHYPLAYHITFGTYGTRLHGDERGTVDRRLNRPGDPIIGADAQWERMERRALQFPPRLFAHDEMILVESLIPAVCTRGGWRLHACAAGPDHVHNVLTPLDPTRGDGEAIRMWLKRWLGQSLAQHLPLRPRETFWAEGGCVRWVWSDDYFKRVVNYVYGQRATERPVGRSGS